MSHDLDEFPISGPEYVPQQVVCCGHQRVLVVGGINAWRRHHGLDFRVGMDVEPREPDIPSMAAWNVDAPNMGAAIVQAEQMHATAVAWVDRLGDPVRFRPVRIAALGGWRMVPPYRAPEAIADLLREIEEHAARDCRERTEGDPPVAAPWFTVLKDGKYTPCVPECPGAEPDLGRWCHWLHHWREDVYEGRKPLRS